jgi:hypothetical protein
MASTAIAELGRAEDGGDLADHPGRRLLRDRTVDHQRQRPGGRQVGEQFEEPHTDAEQERAKLLPAVGPEPPELTDQAQIGAPGQLGRADLR